MASSRSVPALIVCFLITAGIVSAQPSAPIISPEVHADRTVTFRLRAPNAREVKLQMEGLKSDLDLQKDDQGVWSVTTEPLEPEFYGYSFAVDGTTFADPSNSAMKPNLLEPDSEVHVPGPPETNPWEVTDVPHGRIHQHFYKSHIVGDNRDFYVYTPPDYEANQKTKYPVLYLLHGFSDDASGWTSVGHANAILDNLIARGKVKPMVVVMPLGYGEPDILKHGFGAFDMDDLREKNFSKFTEVLLKEVVPQVELDYHVSKDREQHAIAGLSMGGAESLLTGLNHLDYFAWIGSFSAGGIRGNLDEKFPGLDASANKKIRLLWISCGRDDRLAASNEKTDQWLKSKGVDHYYGETWGAHIWPVWRMNLVDFTQLLFRGKGK